MDKFEKLSDNNVDALEKGEIITDALNSGLRQSYLANVTGINCRIISHYYNLYKHMEEVKSSGDKELYSILVKKIKNKEIKSNLMADVLSRIDELGDKLHETFTLEQLDKNLVNCLLKTEGLGERRCNKCGKIKDFKYFRPKRSKCTTCEKIRTGERVRKKNTQENKDASNIITEIKKTVDVIQDRNVKEIESGLETIEYTLETINETLNNVESIPDNLIDKIITISKEFKKMEERTYEINK